MKDEEKIAPADVVITNENVEDVDEGSLLDLKEQTTKGVHLQSELDGVLQSATRTIRNIKPEDSDVLKLMEQEVNDILTDYKGNLQTVSEVNDDLGILGDKHEEIQPVVKY